MIDIFWYFLTSVLSLFGTVALFVLYRLIIGDKYLASAAKLKSLMANLRRDFPELETNAGQFVGKSLEGLGIDGILDSIGIPSIFKPIAKGFIDKIASNPDALKPILDKLGIVLPDGENSKSQKGNLL
jgi:hypothetical protein